MSKDEVSKDEDLETEINLSSLIKELNKKLRKKYPDYDFNKEIGIDRKCKITTKEKCPISIDDKWKENKVSEYQRDGGKTANLLEINGDIVCGIMYKEHNENIPYSYAEKQCMAVLRTKAERQVNEQVGFFT